MREKCIGSSQLLFRYYIFDDKL